MIKMNQLHIGLDFDNTIVLYDEIFYNYALDKKLINENIPKTKNAVRKELIKQNKEELFTEMQGIVYGKLIEKAPTQVGFLESLTNLKKIGCKFSIVSHKTKFPFLGEKYNLHESALKWLHKNKIIGNKYLDINEDDIYFEDTEEKKIMRIKDISCSHYVDDLERILLLLNNKIKKIHFVGNTNTTQKYHEDFFYLNDWRDFNDLVFKIS